MVNIKRWLVHTFMPPWRWRMAFSANVLQEIENTVKQSECRHRGELRFAIENSLASSWVWRGMSAQQRALEVLSNLRVWDTEENSGVLIYLLLADREVHILADRGITRHVAQTEWNQIAQIMQEDFRAKNFRLGSLEGIARVTALLATYFPPEADNPNELSDKPVIVKK
jgi:hypothetical protein